MPLPRVRQFVQPLSNPATVQTCACFIFADLYSFVQELANAHILAN